MDDKTNFLGLGKQLADVLRALDTDISGDPVWTIKKTLGKIYLDIVWTKVKFPAPKVTRIEKSPAHYSQHTDQWEGKQQVDIHKCDKPSATNGFKKKRKSPSTRRRDQQRRKRWLEQKQNNRITSSKPSPSFVGTETVSREIGVELPAANSPAVSTKSPAKSSSAYRVDSSDNILDISPGTTNTRRKRFLPTPPLLTPPPTPRDTSNLTLTLALNSSKFQTTPNYTANAVVLEATNTTKFGSLLSNSNVGHCLDSGKPESYFIKDPESTELEYLRTKPSQSTSPDTSDSEQQDSETPAVCSENRKAVSFRQCSNCSMILPEGIEENSCVCNANSSFVSTEKSDTNSETSESDLARQLREESRRLILEVPSLTLLQKPVIVSHDSLNQCFKPGCRSREHPIGLCSRCSIARYCSKFCQQAHWEEHRELSGKTTDHDLMIADKLYWAEVLS